jgi:hypothetical protein
MARTNKGQETPRIPLAQIEDLMRTSGQRGDALRTDGLTNLAAVKRAKLIQTRRERARLAVRHGEASDRVARLDRQLAVEHRFLVNTRAEADRIKTPTLERDSGAWQVHGYLRSRDGLPRAQYGVSLVADVDGRKTLAETTTDKRGYFHLRLALERAPTDTVDGSTGTDTVARKEDEAGLKAREATESDRIARVLAQALKSPAYLGVTVPGQTGLVVDERPLHPVTGAITYRDLTVANPKDSGSVCQLRTRLLGNSGSRELHDLDNEKPGCQIAEIRPDQRFFFQSIDQAEKLGYDFCAYCFGKARSKR